MQTLRIYRPSSRPLLPLLLVGGLAIWSLLVAELIFCETMLVQFNSLRCVFDLIRGGRLCIVWDLPAGSAPEQVVSLVAQVRLNGRVLAHSTRRYEAAAPARPWLLELPVRPAGDLELRVAALSPQRCVLASGIAKKRTSGEQPFEIKIDFVRLQKPYCLND